MNSQYFSINDLTRSQTASSSGLDNTPNEEALDNLELLVDKVLHPLRVQYGKPIIVTSGYRSKEVNSHPEIGGANNSYHTLGLAADIKGASKEETKKLFSLAQSQKLPFYELLDIYGGSWIHISYNKSNLPPKIITRDQSIKDTPGHSVQEALDKIGTPKMEILNRELVLDGFGGGLGVVESQLSSSLGRTPTKQEMDTYKQEILDDPQKRSFYDAAIKEFNILFSSITDIATVQIPAAVTSLTATIAAIPAASTGTSAAAGAAMTAQLPTIFAQVKGVIATVTGMLTQILGVCATLGIPIPSALNDLIPIVLALNSTLPTF